VMEVEDSARWIIRVLGQGAARLMHGASHADTIGRRLAEFARCEDVIRFRSMWPSDAADVGAQLPPKHRIWIRCRPRESGLRKRKHSGGDGGLEVDGLDELSDNELSYEQSLYAPVIFYAIQLTWYGHILLLGSVGIPQNLGRCGMCGMACCESTYEFQDAQVAVRMRHTLRRPEHFIEIRGVDLEFQEMWTQSVKRDFAWCGVFDRIWNWGYDREQLKRMFTGMPPQLRDATSALTAGVQRLIEMKQRHESTMRRLEQSRGDIPIRDPVALYLSEEAEDLAPDPQDSALITTFYDKHGRRRGFQATRAVAELSGFSCHDEFLASMESCRGPLPVSELELLGVILYQLQMALRGRTQYSVYNRIVRHHDRKPVLVRMDHKFLSNSTVKLTPVSIAEFDHHLATNPSIVRPFMHAIGDCRRGQELLDSAEDDFHRLSVANMRKTPQGMQVLANLASVMEGCVGETVSSMLRGV
jgi:hypothetical protein